VLGGQTEMTSEKPQLKLFVVGELSGNPNDWSAYNCYRALVMAPDAETACKVVDHGGCSVALVEISEPTVLMWEGYDGD
jgi:hypothetical protein